MKHDVELTTFVAIAILIMIVVAKLLKRKDSDVDDFQMVDLTKFNSVRSCRCDCGYTCGGPGVCDLEMMECIEKHFKRDCDHKFEGPLKRIGPGAYSVVCSRCETTASSHDCMVGP